MVTQTNLETVYRLSRDDYNSVLIAIAEIDLNEEPDKLFELFGSENLSEESELRPKEGEVCIGFINYRGILFKEILIKNRINFEVEDPLGDGGLFKRYKEGKLIKEGDINITK